MNVRLAGHKDLVQDSSVTGSADSQDFVLGSNVICLFTR